MREPPRLGQEAITGALREHYDLGVARLEFLPLGADSDSYAFDLAAADGSRWFLKARTATAFREASLWVPHLLHRRGVPHLVAPRPALGGDLWVPVQGYALSLHPFVTGRPATDSGLDDEQWRDLGATVGRIHAQPAETWSGQVPDESYVPSRRELLPRLEGVASGGIREPGPAADLARLWVSREDRIRVLTGTADELGLRLRRARRPLVLCHADLHTWNILVDSLGEWWIVDWDEAVLAPRERDLMFVVRGIGAGLVSARQTECFLRGYGGPKPDPLALAYYRYAWAVQDIAAYAERVLLTPDITVASRVDAFRAFQSLFDPGAIVDIALTTEIPA